MRTNFYIDGFNLFYGSLDKTAYRWLDLAAFCRQSFPEPRNIVNRIRYFTALVKPRASSPGQDVRQQVYLRAIRTIPNVSIHFGSYLESKTRAKLVTPLPDGTRFVQIHKTEEKGSDVNLAMHLLVDGFKNDFDAAVVVSNDSDLAAPIRLMKTELRKPVLVLMPCCREGRKPSYDLKKVATKSFSVDPAILARSQFPGQLTDANGTIHKPSSW